MAAVRVNRGMPRPEAPASSLPKDQWRDLAIVRELWAKSQLPFDCRLLQQVAADAPLMAPELGYGSPEEFLREELQLDPDLVNRVVEWLEQEQPIEAVPLGVADRASKAQAHASAAIHLHGTFAENGNPHGNLDIVKVTKQGTPGNSAAYLAARLKKAGRNDLLEQIGPDKEFRSVRAAAIEAGIIKPVPTVRLVADMAVVAGKLCQHLTQQQRIQLIDLLAPDL
jgi:stage V sporulation protein SpoVS